LRRTSGRGSSTRSRAAIRSVSCDARPAAALSAGELDRSLDALERMQWFSSSQSRDLYALYLRHGLLSRAKQFRDTTRKRLTYNIDCLFDMADRNPAEPIINQ
jgi:hypothetical protein